MKKILLLFLSLVTILSLSACGEREIIKNDTNNTSVIDINESNKDDGITSITSSSANSSKLPESETNQKATENTSDNGGLDKNFKAAMDSYENFMNEYVAFMKKYKSNPSDLSLLTDYADYMRRYSDFVKDYENWENEEMNTAETAYYIEVQARVSKKLLEVAQ